MTNISVMSTVLALAFSFLSASPCFAEILHLELGAANYSVSAGTHARRFLVLEEQATRLIADYGSEGTIYLNDVSEDGLQLAVNYLRSWLDDRRLERITVVGVLGDYTKVRLPKVKTATLNNPGANQLPAKGHRSQEENENIVAGLENLASLSETGLIINSYFTSKGQNYVLQVPEFFTRDSEFRKLSSKNPGYFMPDGDYPGQVYSTLKNTVVKSFQVLARTPYVSPTEEAKFLSPSKTKKDPRNCMSSLVAKD